MITEGLDEAVVTVKAGCVSIECIMLGFDWALGMAPKALLTEAGWPGKVWGMLVLIFIGTELGSVIPGIVGNPGAFGGTGA